ncbi:MAG: regulator [Acidobacteria bacterium]|nr:MAG: regulator [Acidobacteriota bacterium]PIE90454.1 MAG: regulator [Acidobacteriota bacterium]
MSRIIKRYGSRKLYDTKESRYVSLERISDWIKDGQEISVIDNASSEDVTAQTLTQVISEIGRKKNAFLSSDLLHDLIRKGENAVSNSVKQFQKGVDVLMERSIGRLNPVKDIKEEMSILKKRLAELSDSLEQMENKKD